MWPLRSSLASWRRSNPNSKWEDSLTEILLHGTGKNPSLSIRKAVNNILNRLDMLTSGHENCPTPKNIDELIIWWKTMPPK